MNFHKLCNIFMLAKIQISVPKSKNSIVKYNLTEHPLGFAGNG